MSDKKTMKPLCLAVGAALAASMAPVGAASADEAGLFSLTSLANGHMVRMLNDDSDSEGSCGEGRCGGDTGAEGGDTDAEGSCGGDTDAEGSCGGEKGA